MINSCGIILMNYDGKFLLLKNKNYYDFPKGENQENESFLQTALRELKEESSLVNIEFCFGINRFSTEIYRNGKKQAHYFLARTNHNENDVILNINPELGFPEHDAYFWLTKEEICDKLNERVLKVFLEALKTI
jgi:bis(5'-nucleosidyl)-tetraphosphatase